MKATEAAVMVFFGQRDLGEWPNGVLPLMAQRTLEDGRRCLIAVGQRRVLLFVDRPEPELWYAWELERESPTIDDAIIFLDQIKGYISLVEYMALGFDIFEQRQR